MSNSDVTLDENFWSSRYKTGEIGWDLGAPSRPLTEYIDQLKDKDLKILIPGCGSAYEAEYLHKKGFTNVWLLDISQMALDRFAERVPDFPENHLIHANFFEHAGAYNLILEQTFFCAIDPTLREEYVEKAAELLADGGKLVGLLFDDKLNEDHPPFGGNKAEYKTLFEKKFDIRTMEKAYNSIEPRAGRELFIQLVKK